MKDAKWLQENYHFLCNVSEDIMWLLLRLNSDSLFDDNHYPVAHQKITGCSGYQSIKLTKHHFLLQANANDYNTMDTVMRLSSDIASIFGQPYSAVTIDSATYTKAKQLQLRYPEELKVLVRLGGFHITLNYLSLLGKLYTSYGLEDLLIDSGVYMLLVPQMH